MCTVQLDGVLGGPYHVLKDHCLVYRFLCLPLLDSSRIASTSLRINANGAKFLPCREASLDAAVHDLEMRRDFVHNLKTLNTAGEEPLLYRVQIGTYKWFHSLLVVGIVLLMDPNARDAPKLKSHLEEYVNTYKSRPASQRDEMRDREANVIGIFLSRIEQVEKMAAEAKGTAASSRAAQRAPKRGRSTDAGPNSDPRDRLTKSRKRGKDAGDELSDEKSDAHLLLSLDATALSVLAPIVEHLEGQVRRTSLKDRHFGRLLTERAGLACAGRKDLSELRLPSWSVLQRPGKQKTMGQPPRKLQGVQRYQKQQL